MATTINRAALTAKVDDDGTNTTGSLVNKSFFTTVIMDPIDVALAALEAFCTAALVTFLGVAHTWALKQTFTVGPQIPGSRGTAVFGLDSTDTAVLTIANNATATPFSNANNFAGLLLVTELNITGVTALFLIGGAVTLVAQSSGTTFTVTAGTASKVNVYHTAGVMTVENKLGSSTDFRVIGLRMRTTL